MSRKTGFTIIELLTVIAIIGMLCAITEPLLSVSNSRTYEYQCESRLRQVGTAMSAYSQDNGCFPEKLGQVDWLLQDKNLLDCARTSRNYFYACPKPDAERDTLVCSCVDPRSPRGRLPHRFGSAYLVLTAGGSVKRVSR